MEKIKKIGEFLLANPKVTLTVLALVTVLFFANLLGII